MILFLDQKSSDDFLCADAKPDIYQNGKCFLLQYICVGQTSLSFNIKIADGMNPQPNDDNLDLLDR